MGRRNGRKTGRPAGTTVQYQQVADRLREKINAGELRDGSILPSYRTLARALGAGDRATWLAINVLKQEGRLAATGKRRLAVVGSAVGHSLTTRCVLEVIGYNLRETLQDFTADIQIGIQLGAGDLERPLTVLHGHKLLRHLPDEISLQRVFGIVLVRNLDKGVLSEYENLPLPVVMVDRPGEDWKLHSASADNENAAYDATMQFLALNHRSLAFVRYASAGQRGLDPDSRERQAGFLRAIRDKGLSQRDFSLITFTPTMKSNALGFAPLFRKQNRPTAILCSSSSISRFVLTAIREHGMSVPKDYSVACFQGVKPEMPQVSGPRFDFKEMARAAVRLLTLPRTPFQRLRISPTWHSGSTVRPHTV